MEKMIWQKFILGTGNLDGALSRGLGGVIFFTRDIESEEQFTNLIKDIKTKASIPPFLSIDQEGGRVERTEKIRPKRVSNRYAFDKGIDFLSRQAEEISEELYNWGINLNFAPCIDVNTNPNNPIIGERAFSDNAVDVITGMNVFLDSSRKFNIIPCVKHFPGHGDADKDSHLTLPQINLSLSEMEKVHIRPFKFAVDNNIEMVMVAHLHCTCFDVEEVPASLSKNVIGYLRKELKYDGVVVSDDMIMKGVQKYGLLEAVIKGIRAGVDMFIFRESSSEVLDMIKALQKIVEEDDEIRTKVVESYNRIILLKKKYKMV